MFCSDLIFANQRQVMTFKPTKKLVREGLRYKSLLKKNSSDLIAFKTELIREVKDLRNTNLAILTGMAMYAIEYRIANGSICNDNISDKVVLFAIKDTNDDLKFATKKDGTDIVERSVISYDFLKSFFDTHNIDISKSAFISREEVKAKADVKVQKSNLNSKDSFTYVGVAVDKKGRKSVKYTNDPNRGRRLIRDGFTDVKFINLPHSMTKREVNAYLSKNSFL